MSSSPKSSLSIRPRAVAVTEPPNSEISPCPSPPTLPARRTRTGNPKTRTGCVTCKIRRIKCDEKKPACDRCTSTGRTCDGYYLKPRKKRETRVANITDLPPTTLTFNVKDCQALEFFLYKTAPTLSSYFDADFWAGLVVQSSHSEPCIKHAMIAIAALHRSRDRLDGIIPYKWTIMVRGPLGGRAPFDTYSDDTEDEFAITHYNRAITHLVKRMDDTRTSIQVTLLACILFIGIECLRNNREYTNRHFRAGMNIAMGLMQQHDRSTGSSEMTTFRESMLPIFNRVEVLCMLMGYDPTWDYPVDMLAAVPEQLLTMREARDSIVHLANLSIRFVRSLRSRRLRQAILPSDYATQAALLEVFTTWEGALVALMLRTDLSPSDLEGAKLLRLHYIVTKNWLHRCTRPTQTDTDDYLRDFIRAISLAESIQALAATLADESNTNLTTSPTTKQKTFNFGFEMELISPLFYVAKQCRHPVHRRRAVALLKNMHRREGLWDSDVAGAIAERIVQIEEANLSVLDGSELPAIRDRVWRSSIMNDGCTNSLAKRVVFYACPDGVDKRWKMWTELITVGGPHGLCVLPEVPLRLTEAQNVVVNFTEEEGS